MNLHIPPEAGGPGVSLLAETLVSEATGYGCAGMATSIMCNNLAFAPLVIGATIEQLKEYVEPLITGKDAKFGSFCLTERKAGSDVAAIATRAERDGDEYIINGMKCFATNAPQASLFTVFASTQPELKHKGLSVFMVPKTKGVKIGFIENKVGQKNSVQRPLTKRLSSRVFDINSESPLAGSKESASSLQIWVQERQHHVI
jgi:acyl-CoA dehydrogenase